MLYGEALAGAIDGKVGRRYVRDHIAEREGLTTAQRCST